MRPLRLLLSLATSLVTITLLLYLVFGSHPDDSRSSTVPAQDRGTFKSLFSFTSPGSLFPPSAIISLTDDNSTFFLARPAAFGPSLPSDSVSGPLWIGSGFGEDSMGKGGELGCSDIPGWDGSEDMPEFTSAAAHRGMKDAEGSKNPLTKQPHGAVDVAERSIADNDGTDDHLQPRPPLLPKYRIGKTPEHADIESLQQAAEISGKVVLLKRGGCGFLEKVKWAQSRGGVALIVGDDQRGGALVRMYARGDTSNVTIPALFTSHTTAHLLSSLLPTGETSHGPLSADTTKMALIKGARPGKNREKTGRGPLADSKQTQRASSGKNRLGSSSEVGWLSTVLIRLGIKHPNGISSKDATRRPPNSGRLNWANGQDVSREKPMTRTAQVAAMHTPQDFIIGEQDWRDPALLASSLLSTTTPEGSQTTGLNHLKEGEKKVITHVDVKESNTTSATNKQPESSKPSIPHEGLWVTLTPTNMSTSPFFDTLLVLVVSPLVTLTVVYALLLLRSRIRRRRWRAPKSLVDRLPVRTYHTISDSSPSATPSASSPTTPLLQHEPPIPTPSQPRPQSVAEIEVPATSSSLHPIRRTPEEEKRESGLAAWRRKYGGRQRECVVCLEEYVDGISQVMSLPCGHEFHADCITPWLVTRRRTCPICKGDVVRSLSQSYHDHAMSRLESGVSFSDELVDDVQAQAALSRNDSPSASRPLPISPGPIHADIEANWDEEGHERDRAIAQERTDELSSSFREAGSSAVTAIWRGFEAVGRATGLQRRSSREELDRDR